jgi:GDP-4-dehydro-6-deoxy-D-mannose reductase
MPTALVTGARGFVGGHLGPALRDAGWRVETFDGDIRRPESARRFRGDAVFHLAAQSNPRKSFVIPHETFEVNAIGTERLLVALEAGGFGGRVLVVSTGEVYRMDPRPRRETDALAPRNPYAWSKVMAEAAARSSRLDVVVARPFNHTGPGQAPAYVCASFARQVRTQDEIRVGQLESLRDFTDVRDVVRAYRLLAERGRRGETYNVCSGRAHTIGWILETLIGASGREVRVTVDPALVRAPDVLVGDPSKVHAHTGWRTEVPFEETLASMVAPLPRRSRGCTTRASDAAAVLRRRP